MAHDAPHRGGNEAPRWTQAGRDDTAVEVDESYIGGKLKNKHLSAKKDIAGTNLNKTIVMGALDREKGHVRAEVIPAAKRDTMTAMVQKYVKFGLTVYTDNHVGYDTMRHRYTHDTINHINEYVRGQVHTNGIENFWSLLKRGIAGTYIAVEPERRSNHGGKTFLVRSGEMSQRSLGAKEVNCHLRCVDRGPITVKDMTYNCRTPTVWQVGRQLHGSEDHEADEIHNVVSH